MTKLSRRDFIAFGAGVTATVGGLFALGQWDSREVPITRTAGDKVQLFLHIPKTGGTSLREHIMKSVKAHQIAMPERPDNIWHLQRYYSHYLNEYDYIYVRGHFAKDWTRFLTDYTDKTESITMLRDPIARFRSAYQYQTAHWATKGSYAERLLARKPENLSAAIDLFDEDHKNGTADPHFLMEFNDGMTRRLCGNKWNVPYRETTRDMLDTAKDNLDKHFKIIGVTEDYNKFLYLLKLEYGWKLNPSIRKNATKNKMDVSAKDRDKIAALNTLDIELHAHAKTRADALFNQLSAEDQANYDNFINSNAG